MGYPTVRVSPAAHEELKRRSEAEGRTVVSVVDRLVGVNGAESKKNSRVPPAQTTNPLHGLQEAIGTSEEFPLTTRPGEYMGIDRGPVVESKPCKCGHPKAQHRPKCLMKGCGCLGYVVAKELF